MSKYIILVLSLVVFFTLALPIVFEKTIESICNNALSKSNYSIKIEDPKLNIYLIPKVKFFAKRVFIKKTDDITKYEFNNILFDLRLLPLLSKKMHFNKIEIEDFVIDIKLAKKIQFNAEFFNEIEKFGVVCDNADIKKYKIKFYPADNSIPIIYQGENFFYKLNSRYLKLKINSEFIIADKISKAYANLYLPKVKDIKKTIFEIEVKNVDLSRIYMHLKDYFPKDVEAFSGLINVTANKGELKTEILNCKILNKDEFKNIIFPQKFNIVSKFTLSKKDILFEKINVFSDKINMSLDGVVSNYLAKAKTKLNLNVRIDSSKLEEIIKILPAFKTEEFDVYSLKKYKFYGDIIGNLMIKGTLPEPDINGEIYINNGVLVKPIPNTRAGAVIKLKFWGRHVDFDVNVPAGGYEKVTVKGTQEIYNVRFADLTVKSSPSVNLAVAQEVVNPLHEILNFIVGPLPIMKIDGFGNIDINAKGNRKNPHVWGVLNISNCSAYFLDMPDFVLKNAESSLVFNNQDATFNLKQGAVNGKDFSINGSCNLNGRFDFNIFSKDQPVKNLYRSLQTCKLVPEFKILPTIDNLEGIADLDLKIYGNVRSLKEICFNKNIFGKGNIIVKNAIGEFQKIKIHDLSGNIKLDAENSYINLAGLMDKENLDIKAVINKKNADVTLLIPKFNPAVLIEDACLKSLNIYPLLSVNAKYKGSIDDIDITKVKLNATIIPQEVNNYINYDSGSIVIDNNKMYLKNIKGNCVNASNLFALDLKYDKPFEKNLSLNGEFYLKTPNIAFVNDFVKQNILPKNINDILQKMRFDNGAVDLKGRIINNKINLAGDLSGYKLTYKPWDLPIEIMNGNFVIKNNVLKLDAINVLADDMPILIDGTIKDFVHPSFDIYINSKPKQDFIDKYINKNQVYPIKIKGDMVYKATLKGALDDFNLKSLLNMSKNASVYHFGATVGDVENAIALDLDTRIVNGKELKIKDFSYDKLINSQSGKQTKLNMLKAWGDVNVYKDDLLFKDLHIKTNTPTDARIFNIIFRKPNIKQGQFTSDLKINNKLSNPDVLGDFHIFETEIPFFDTTMKNIGLVFKDKTIEVAAKGDILGNDVIFDGVLKNKLSAPYHIEKANLYTKNLDLNKIVNKLKVAEVDNVSTFESFEDIDLSDITFNQLRLKADSIQLRNINATDFETTAFLNQKGKFDMQDFVFNIAQGSLKGKYGYDLKSGEMDLDLKAESIDANDIAWALFDLKNQIYGDLTGKVELSCNGTNFQSCMQTISGTSKFKVKDGKMPKLGSLEYLLKAGNIVKGGITGLSLSGIIDVITPLKTGEFSEISGQVRIKDGVARNIEIGTRGKDLSLFIIGTYNFSTAIADMEVFGYLSKKINNMFGAIGNLSMNTLFNMIPGVDLSADSELLEKINRIPGLELSNKNFRKFLAEIQGNINGEDYVKSFRWVN